MIKSLLAAAIVGLSPAAQAAALRPLSDGTDSNYCRHQSDDPRLYRIDGKYYCIVNAKFPSSFRFAMVGADADRHRPALAAIEQRMAKLTGGTPKHTGRVDVLFVLGALPGPEILRLADADHLEISEHMRVVIKVIDYGLAFTGSHKQSCWGELFDPSEVSADDLKYDRAYAELRLRSNRFFIEAITEPDVPFCLTGAADRFFTLTKPEKTKGHAMPGGGWRWP